MSTQPFDHLPHIELTSQEPWREPDDLPDLQALGINPNTHRNIYQRQVLDFSPKAGITSVASPGFVACSGLLLKDHESGIYTFGHLQPDGASLEKHLGDKNIEQGEAVILLGSISVPPVALRDLNRGKWGDISTKIISFESGSTWWAGVFNAITGVVSIARRRPDTSLLHYQATPPQIDN